MNENQILVVHSRWVYNFMGIILEAQVCFIYQLLCILFKNLFQILVIFKPYTLEKTVIEKALHANECVRWIEAFIANLGHPLWGPQCSQCRNKHLEWGMFCLSSLELLSLALTASPITVVPDLQWMPLFISHTHLHVVLSLWRSLLTYIRFENHQNLKLIFEKNA